MPCWSMSSSQQTTINQSFSVGLPQRTPPWSQARELRRSRFTPCLYLVTGVTSLTIPETFRGFNVPFSKFLKWWSPGETVSSDPDSLQQSIVPELKQHHKDRIRETNRHRPELVSSASVSPSAAQASLVQKITMFLSDNMTSAKDWIYHILQLWSLTTFRNHKNQQPK